MKGWLMLGVGGAAGYVLGTRAGREKYDSMMRTVRNAMERRRGSMGSDTMEPPTWRAPHGNGSSMTPEPPRTTATSSTSSGLSSGM